MPIRIVRLVVARPSRRALRQTFGDTAARLLNQFAKKADNDLELLKTSSEESKQR